MLNIPAITPPKPAFDGRSSRAMTRNVWRPAILSGLGAVGLLLAGCHDMKHSQDIASGKDFSLSQAEFAQALAASPPVAQANADAMRDQTLHKLIDEKLLANAAKKEGLDHEPETIQVLLAAQRSILARAYALKLTAGVSAPSDAGIADFYNHNPQIFTSRVSADVDEFLLQGPPGPTNNVLKLFDSGAPLPQVIASASDQGVLISHQSATLTSDTVPPDVVTRLNSATVGSNIVFGSSSAMIAARVNAVQPAPLTLAQASPQIRKQMLQRRKSEVLKMELERLRTAANVKINSKPAAPQPARQAD